MDLNFFVPPVALDLKPALQAKIDAKTKPLGALGRLETLALQIGLIQQSLTPELHHPSVLIFAGDHGICAEHVSPYPSAVTQQMVLNFLAGGAAINVFAAQQHLQLRIIDAGVNADFAPHAQLIDAKIAKGTANFLQQAAMSHAQCQLALQQGRHQAHQQIARGSNVLGFGEMGIGNTSSASAMLSSICDWPASLTTGRGTGLDDKGLQHKQTIIEQALTHHAHARGDALESLRCFGGFEIAMLTGAMLGAAEQGCLLLIDGFISSCALLVAARLQPNIVDYCVFSHCSAEAAHHALLQELGGEPLLKLNMRLGEGSAAALAYSLVEAAVRFLTHMASFDSAGISQRNS